MVINKSKWFTILEIVIAMTISLVVILIISYFIGEINAKISSSQNKSKIYVWISDLVEKINSKKNIYPNSTILTSQTGSYNTLLLTNTSKNWGLLIWVVNLSSWTLDSVSDYNTYDHKVIWMKELNGFQMNQIIANTWSIYNIDFYDDNVFPDLNMKSLSLTPYNSWAITEAMFTFYEDYLPWYKWKAINTLQDIQTYDLTLDF